MRRKSVCFLLLGLLAQTLYAEEPVIEAEPNPDASMQRIALEKDTAIKNLLTEIEKRYGETATLIKSLDQQIDQKRKLLGKVQRDIDYYGKLVAKENKELNAYVKSAYALGKQDKIKLLLNQQDPALSSRMMVYYTYLNKVRLAKLAKIQAFIEHLVQLDKQEQVEADLIAQKLEQKKAEQLALKQVKNKRNELLAQTADIEYTDEQRLSLLEENENTLKKLIASLESPEEAETKEFAANNPSAQTNESQASAKLEFSKITGAFSSSKGKLPWPVKGKVVHQFASLKSETIQNGVLIDAHEGAEVHAVAKGKVAFAGQMKSYGYLVIIDHGEGFMTLYAFNRNNYKHKDDIVEPGEIIADVGQTGGRHQPGLYFGIRKQGIPIDPLEWFSKL